jgi:hypothetical protein
MNPQFLREPRVNPQKKFALQSESVVEAPTRARE